MSSRALIKIGPFFFKLLNYSCFLLFFTVNTYLEKDGHLSPHFVVGFFPPIGPFSGFWSVAVENLSEMTLSEAESGKCRPRLSFFSLFHNYSPQSKKFR